MAHERVDATDIDFTDAELDVFGDFTEAVQRCEHPDMEKYLARCPGSEAKMRQILEMALLMDSAVTQYRRKYPHVDLRKLRELVQEQRGKEK
jgi:hypothetical protein